MRDAFNAGTILGIPLNMAVDAFWRNRIPLPLTVVGCGIIAVSFSLLLLAPPRGLDQDTSEARDGANPGRPSYALLPGAAKENGAPSP